MCGALLCTRWVCSIDTVHWLSSVAQLISLQNNFLGVPRIEPTAAGWEVRTLPLCYALPLSLSLFVWVHLSICLFFSLSLLPRNFLSPFSSSVSLSLGKTFVRLFILTFSLFFFLLIFLSLSLSFSLSAANATNACCLPLFFPFCENVLNWSLKLFCPSFQTICIKPGSSALKTSTLYQRHHRSSPNSYLLCICSSIQKTPSSGKKVVGKTLTTCWSKIVCCWRTHIEIKNLLWLRSLGNIKHEKAHSGGNQTKQTS